MEDHPSTAAALHVVGVRSPGALGHLVGGHSLDLRAGEESLGAGAAGANLAEVRRMRDRAGVGEAPRVGDYYRLVSFY